MLVKNQSLGFSLIELLITVSVAVILLTLSVPVFSRFILQNEVSSTASRLAGSLRKAQIASLVGKKGSAWGVSYQNNQITLFKGSSYITRDSTLDEKYPVNANVAINNFSEVVFSKTTGLPNIYGSYVISSGNNSQTISVNQEGVISR